MNGNGHGHRPSVDDYGVPPRTGVDPSGKVVVDSYRADIVNGFEKDASMYNPMNSERTQSSSHVDLADPIQVHLLTETALSDSKEYEILSQEEIDDLKKQCAFINQRIDSTRSNLLIQAKFRDAAISMAKLYSPTNTSPDAGIDETDRQADAEREESERRCEELAAELFHLEKKIMEPKRRLLEHTAGILQLTHKASKRKGAMNDQAPNGVPGSPESMYTYTQSRNSLDGPDDFYTDDTSFTGFDPLDTRGPRKNPLEIPMKSPIREQQSQLKEENQALIQSIAEMEKKLEGLNGSLRETIVRFNPEGNAGFDGPPDASQSQGMKPGEMLWNQIEYLESGLVAVQAEQESRMNEPRGVSDSSGVDRTLMELWEMIQTGYTSIKEQNYDRRRARAEKGLESDESDDDGIDLAESYNVLNFSTRVRWLYRQATTLKDQKSVLKRQIKQQRELNNKSDAEKDAELAQKQEELEQSHVLISRAEKDFADAQRMLSETLEDLEQAREDALQARSNAGPSEEIQTELREREARTQVLEAKLQDMQQELAHTEAESQSTQQRLLQVDESISALSTQLDEATRARDEAQAALQSRNTEYDDLNLLYANLKTEITIARAELDGAYGTRAERAADVAAKQTNSEIERLRTELRATAQELEDVTKETLASEREKIELETKLDEALAVRSEVEAEISQVRERMDEEISRARERIETLQEELDGERLKAGRGSGDGPGRVGMGATMLSEQFRTTMREERKKYQEDIKEERARYRKLEEELSRLKRAQGPGKSPLSPRQ
ncbi:involucrin repeat protein [Emericellopsis atlantica]|uniref:Involucrin repeat protein n=1 Tax=Emericellopsis atlantica TaxID=2614577 RepID=A0A9P8CSH1_9HYPO|nr:involucrin repeat protein [Emericellopsis atlantica]KAG9258089.1 involucrin repeat protein [Emericellopsis atlantica]